MTDDEELLVPHRPIGRSFVPARSPLARYSECRGSPVLANRTTRKVCLLSPAGYWLWERCDGTQSVGDLLDELVRDGVEPRSPIMAVRRLRADGLILEADRAPCAPLHGDPHDAASTGEIELWADLKDAELTIPGAYEVFLTVSPLRVLAGTYAVVAVQFMVPGGDSLGALEATVKALSTGSWAQPGALDLAASLVETLVPET